MEGSTSGGQRFCQCISFGHFWGLTVLKTCDSGSQDTWITSSHPQGKEFTVCFLFSGFEVKEVNIFMILKWGHYDTEFDIWSLCKLEFHVETADAHFPEEHIYGV